MEEAHRAAKAICLELEALTIKSYDLIIDAELQRFVWQRIKSKNLDPSILEQWALNFSVFLSASHAYEEKDIGPVDPSIFKHDVLGPIIARRALGEKETIINELRPFLTRKKPASVDLIGPSKKSLVRLEMESQVQNLREDPPPNHPGRNINLAMECFDFNFSNLQIREEQDATETIETPRNRPLTRERNEAAG